jgi:hypothetical protein
MMNWEDDPEFYVRNVEGDFQILVSTTLLYPETLRKTNIDIG